MELLLAIIGGAICGAILVGIIIAGIVWWQNQQRINDLRSSLNNPNQSMGGMSPPPASSPPNNNEAAIPYQSGAPQPNPINAENVTYAEPAGVTQGSAWLDGVGGIVKGQRMVVVKEETLLGRSGVCDLQFHDPKVSRQHAMLRIHNTEYFLQDMQSSRGTYVNGRRVDTHQLRDRDQIQIGDTVLVFRRYS